MRAILVSSFVFVLPFLLHVVSTAFSPLTCDTDKVYVNLYKMSKSRTNEEKFEMHSGSWLLQRCSALSNNGERIMEYRIASSTHNQYTLKLIDEGEYSWGSDSFLAVYGE